MDQQPKKPARDLNDLKARLGLTKEGGATPGGATGNQPAVRPGPAGIGQQPGIGPFPTGNQPAVGIFPPGTSPGTPAVPGGPGVFIPPPAGPTGQFRAPAPTAEPRRDPFANARVVMAAAAPAITDAGPQIALPEQKKNYLPLVGMAAGILLVGLLLGYMFGGVSHARKLFNRTIEDARRIHTEIGKMAKLEQGIVIALADSRKREHGQIAYDPKLIEDLKQAQMTSAYGQVENAKKIEQVLFRSNYAMMDDLLISRLFSYYNNSLRMVQAVDDFVDAAERNKDDIIKYTSESADSAQRKYGIVFAEDKGAFYLGALVEVGKPVCHDAKATAEGRCRANQIEGFEVKTSGGKGWSKRAGKPSKKSQLSDIVIPIIPDRTWQDVASAKPGAMAYARYVARYKAILRIATLLDHDRKPLLESLEKQADRESLASL